MTESNYWRFIRVDSTNKRQIQTIATAKTYFQNQFTQASCVSDAKIVYQLWQQMHQNRKTYSNKSHLAEVCLRCAISHRIDKVCLELGIKFGIDNGFSREDLLPFVLPDEVLWANSKRQAISNYKSLTTSLLQTFNPDKGSLNNWVKRYVIGQPELKKFLLEHGVFIISDWALLNDTNPQKLQLYSIDMHNVPTVEIQQRKDILISYHTVYREDRLQQRSRGITLPCQAPTSEQLNCMADDIKKRTGRILSHELLLKQLQEIATKIRQYKISARGGYVSETSLDKSGIQPIAENSQPNYDDEEQTKFLQLYELEFIESLDKTIAQVIDKFGAKLKPQANNNKNKNKESLLKGLHLFHCQGQGMGQIAPHIGFKKQYEVSRFLRLNEFRADIRHKLLINLRERVTEIIKDFTSYQRLEALDKKIESILDEQILDEMEKAKSETKSPVKNQAFCSLFARRLCHYLKSQNIHNIAASTSRR